MPAAETKLLLQQLTTAPSNPLEGKWEQIDFRSTLERSLGYEEFSSRLPRRLIYSDAFKDVTPTLTITGDSAVYDLTATTNVAVGNFMTTKAQKLTSVQGTKEQYIKNQYDDLKKKNLELLTNIISPQL